MEEVETTWGKAIIFWWALTWRAVLYTLIIAFVIGFLAGIVLSVLDLSVEEYSTQLSFVGFATGIIVSISVTKEILSKQFGGFRVALVRTE